MKTINLNKDFFDKISKRLHKEIKNKYSNNISLSEIHEILSQSFGFRNYNSLNVFLKSDLITNENSNSYKPNINYFLNNWTSEEYISLIADLIPNEKNMWTSRAISLISAIIISLVYMRDRKEIVLNFQTIFDNLQFENIIKLYKQRTDFPEYVRNALKSYLLFLPGFKESSLVQNDTAFEQHAVLQMQFTKILHDLIKVENKQDFILEGEWFDIKDGNVFIKEKIYKCNLYSGSWIEDSYYLEIIKHLLKQKKQINAGDLLKFYVNMTDKRKKEITKELILNVLNNYNSFLKLAKEFNSANNSI